MVGNDFKLFAQQVQAAISAARQTIDIYADQQKELAARLQVICNISVQGISEVASQVVSSFAEMQKFIEPLAQQIAQAFQVLPERNKKALRIFAENGWYLDPVLSLPDLFETAELFEVGEVKSAHQKLCNHFETRLDGIQHDICNKFLNRSKILRAAFEAHRRGEYALSVPIFLSQADGICYELVGVQLYTRRNGIPLLATRLRYTNIPPFHASILYPLVEPFPISAGPTERDSQTDSLYRHSILHGESCDYDTKLNSCRSISLLLYVCWILDKQSTN